MKPLVVIKRLDCEALRRLDNLRYMARRDFYPFRMSQRDMKAPRKPLGTHRFQHAGVGKRPIGGQQRAWAGCARAQAIIAHLKRGAFRDV